MKGMYLVGLGGIPDAAMKLGIPIHTCLSEQAIVFHDDDKALVDALCSLDELLTAQACAALGRWNDLRGLRIEPFTLDDLRERAEAVAQVEGEEARLDAEALRALIVALETNSSKGNTL